MGRRQKRSLASGTLSSPKIMQFGLAIRCDATRRRSAAIGLALAGVGGIHVSPLRFGYDKDVYERLDSSLRIHVRVSPHAAVLERIRRFAR